MGERIVDVTQETKPNVIASDASVFARREMDPVWGEIVVFRGERAQERDLPVSSKIRPKQQLLQYLGP